MRPFTGVLAAAAALALTCGTAHAQTRDGFFIGLGAGVGSAKVTCDGCEGDTDGAVGLSRETSFTGHVRLGKTITSRFAVGAELNAWLKKDDFDISTHLFDATAAVYVYPNDEGLFVKAGAGLSRVEVKLGGDLGDASVSGTGLGLMAGVGYDVGIGRTTAITPMVTYWYGKPGELKIEGVPLLVGVKHNVIEFGVGISFY
jgi:hypothetical protein